MSSKNIVNRQKILELKKYVTIAESATYLSKVLSEEVTEADIYKFAFEGRLKLSVEFVNSTGVYRGRVKPNENREFGRQDEAGSELAVIFEDEVTEITGIWDLPMKGNGYSDIKNKYMALIDGPNITTCSSDGVLVENENGECCKLLKCVVDVDVLNVTPATKLPDDSLLLICTQKLIDFQNSLMNESEEKGAPPYMRKSHPRFAKELFIAVSAWTELYAEKTKDYKPSGGHIPHIKNWLKDNFPETSKNKLGKNSRDRIATIVNPDKRGGASST